MYKFLFILGIILLASWGIGIFFYSLKGLFNIILIFAVVAFVLGLFNKNKSKQVD